MASFIWPEIHQYHEVDLIAPEQQCRECNRNLWVTQWRPRKLWTLNGLIVLKMIDKRCPDKKCPGRKTIHRHPGAMTFAVPNDSLGIDVLLRIGDWRLNDHLSFAAIHRKLLALNIQIGERTVSKAFLRFLTLLRGIDGESPAARQQLQSNGIVLLVDGVQFDDISPILYVAIDVRSQTVLFAERHDARSADALEVLLQRVKQLNVPVHGIVTDKESGLVPAIQRVFPDVPHQYCQLHFINRCAQPLARPLAELNGELEVVGQHVRKLRRELAKLPPSLDADDVAERELAEGLLQAAHAATKVSGRAPFDPPALKRHERLQAVQEIASTAASQRSRKKGGGH